MGRLATTRARNGAKTPEDAGSFDPKDGPFRPVKSNPGSAAGRAGASSVSQPLLALQAANAVRCGQSKWRRTVAALPAVEGRRYLADLLEGGEFERGIARLPLRRFLISARAVGPRKASEIMRSAGMARRDPRVEDLTARERMGLATELRRRAAVTMREVRP